MVPGGDELCAACGQPRPADARFCPSCGATVAPPSCASCGSELLPGARFCASCGTPTSSSAPEAAGHESPVAERRLTSVLFGDLVGFTTISEARDPEQVRELLTSYFARCREVVARYDGVIEKFIGDAVMAVWGVPVAHEDDAERAVRAGTDLAAMVAALGVELGAPLALRVGIVTGEVAVTIGATAEGMVSGDPVNTASRVQSSAEPGQVWVDAPTRALTASVVEYDDTGEHPLKGKAEPMRLYAVRTVHADRVQTDGVQAPLAGRDRELALLRDLFSATAAEGRPRLVVVDGEAGVGKSRLVAEFQAWVDSLETTVRWHRGRCLSYGEGIAFWALSEAVRTRLGLLEGDTGAVVGDRLDELLSDVVGDADERDHLRSRLLALVSAAVERTFERGDLFSAWTRFFELVGSGDPVVIVLDDAHHADDGLLDFVDHVMATSRAPIFVIAMARRELVGRRPGWGGRRAAVVPLDPLDDASMRALVESLVPGLPPDASAALVSRTGGLPLFAVETVRSLVDQGVAVVDAGHASLARGAIDLDTLAAPESLRSLVTARLDALSAPERRVVADASVLGMAFTLDGLVALGSDQAVLDDAVAALLRRELLAVEADRFSGERGQLRFVHAVVRQVAYGVLSRRDRKARHLAAAAYLGEQVDDSGDIDGVVAQHLLDALDAAFDSDTDVPTIRAEASLRLRAAGDRAKRLGAPAQAMRLLVRASELCGDEREAAVILAQAADAATDAGEQEQGVELAESAVATLDRVGDAVAAAEALAVQARALSWLGRYPALLALLEERLPGVEATPGAERSAFDLLERLVVAYANLGPPELDRSTSLRLMERGLASRDPKERIRGYVAQAAVCITDEDWPGAIAAYDRVIDLSRACGDMARLAVALINVSVAHSENDPHRGLERIREATAEAQRAGLRNIAEFAETGIPEYLYILGRMREMSAAVDALDIDDLTPNSYYLGVWVEALNAQATGRPVSNRPFDRIAEGTQSVAMQQMALLERANAEGRAAEADIAARQVVQLHRDGGTLAVVWSVVPGLLRALEGGDAPIADTLVALTSDVDPSTATPMRRAYSLWVRGAVGSLRGWPSAASDLRAAVDALESYGAPGFAARAKAELGLLLARRGEAVEADALLAQAEATYREIGAWGWLAALDRRRAALDADPTA